VENALTLFVVEATRKLAQCRERLLVESERCWGTLLQDFSNAHHTTFSGVIGRLATLDCLFSLSEVAKLPGYCRPDISEAAEVILKDSRHPMVERLMHERATGGYVPNDVSLTVGGERCMVITGPNMGGKSSYIRQVALIVLMAQIGSYVPAASARVGVFDAIYARMGARDDLVHGQSTFMVELQETSDILRRATDRSLVILDELGRGTSTHDGVAIAHATLEHLLTEVRSALLFVTHYPQITGIADAHPSSVGCYSMAFLQDTAEGPHPAASPRVTFLYKLHRGVAPSSFGLNVARLAGIPEAILKVAQEKSREMGALSKRGGAAAPTSMPSHLPAIPPP